MIDRMPGAQVESEKRELRRRMRRLRKELLDRPGRSSQLWRHVAALPAVAAAERLMGFSTVPGEPEVADFSASWTDAGGEWAVPEDAVDAAWPDVVLVPGLAFTADGERLGQGGGWYDRFLTDVRSDCVAIGVGFHEQILAGLPTEPHDVRLDGVVTDAGVALAPGGSCP